MDWKEKEEAIRRYAYGLDLNAARHELFLAFKQMEYCLGLLRGEHPTPVTMRDNGFMTDLELFYACKKRMEELADLEKESVTDYSLPDKAMGDVEAFRKYLKEKKEHYPEHSIHDVIYFMQDSRIVAAKVTGIDYNEIGGYFYKTEKTGYLDEAVVSGTIDGLLKKLKDKFLNGDGDDTLC